MLNNPTFSDVKIRQISNGEVKEYYAHKAVLCAHSKWFMKAFTGNFNVCYDPNVGGCGWQWSAQEACESVTELNDDDPEVFEFMLQFFYNVHGDLSLPLYHRLTTDIEEKHLYLPIKVHTLADKYDAGPLQRWAVSTLKDNLAKREDDNYIT
jgi:hypothetical protein